MHNDEQVQRRLDVGGHILLHRYSLGKQALLRGAHNMNAVFLGFPPSPLQASYLKVAVSVGGHNGFTAEDRERECLTASAKGHVCCDDGF